MALPLSPFSSSLRSSVPNGSAAATLGPQDGGLAAGQQFGDGFDDFGNRLSASVNGCATASSTKFTASNGENGENTLHPKSFGLADEFELGFMESVEAQLEKIGVAKIEGAGEQAADFSVDSLHPPAGKSGLVEAQDSLGMACPALGVACDGFWMGGSGKAGGR
jgi:hypothetical protein